MFQSLLIHSPTEIQPTSQLLPILASMNKAAKHQCSVFCMDISFQLLRVKTKACDCWIIWEQYAYFVRNHQTTFQSGCTTLHPHQQFMSVPVGAQPGQHLVLSVF